MKKGVLIACMLLGLGAASAVAQDAMTGATPNSRPSAPDTTTGATRKSRAAAPTARLSQQQAEAIAVKQAGGGQVVKYELDTEHGRLMHEVDVIANGIKYEAEIDDATGMVLKFKQD